MKEKLTILGTFEEFILLAVLRLQHNAYGVKIRQVVSEAAEKEVSIGALYTTLDRLQSKGFVSSWEGDPTPERGGRAKRFYKVEPAGLQALKETKRTRGNIEAGVDISLALLEKQYEV